MEIMYFKVVRGTREWKSSWVLRCVDWDVVTVVSKDRNASEDKKSHHLSSGIFTVSIETLMTICQSTLHELRLGAVYRIIIALKTSLCRTVWY
jgi:hypothetical protein